MQGEKGFIYILAHNRMPGIVKIGYTTISVKNRVCSMDSESGVPGRFDVIFSKEVKNPYAVERIIHSKLDAFRLLPNKEFFELKPSLAIDYVRLIIENDSFEINIAKKHEERMQLIPDSKALGKLVRHHRKKLKIRQSDLAMVANTGKRFIIDMEKGKRTVQLGKVLDILNALKMDLIILPSLPPPSDPPEYNL